MGELANFAEMTQGARATFLHEQLNSLVDRANSFIITGHFIDYHPESDPDIYEASFVGSVNALQQLASRYRLEAATWRDIEGTQRSGIIKNLAWSFNKKTSCRIDLDVIDMSHGELTRITLPQLTCLGQLSVRPDRH
jgi:hypothetical protein